MITATAFAAALKALPDRIRPSQAYPNLRLEGLENISASVGKWLSQKSHAHLKVVERGAEKFAGS